MLKQGNLLGILLSVVVTTLSILCGCFLISVHPTAPSTFIVFKEFWWMIIPNSFIVHMFIWEI